MSENNKTGWKKYLLNELALTAIICLLIIGVAKSLNIVRVSGMSMYPTYTPNELLRSTTNTSNIKLEDIVVFTVEAKKLGKPSEKNGRSHKIIKRVVGVEGDIIEIKNGNLYRNSVKVEDDFDSMKNPGIIQEPILVPDDEVFVLGDNRNNSNDSRKFGTIKEKYITNIIKGKLLSFKNQK